MTYVVGIAMLVTGLVCLDLGQSFLRSAQRPSFATRFVGGDFFALSLTTLLGGGVMTLLAGPMTDFGAASLAKFGLSLALVIAVVAAWRILAGRRPRARRGAAPA